MEAIKSYLKEICKVPLLNAQEEITLSNKIKKGDEQARKHMIRANLRLVISNCQEVHLFGYTSD